jgi:hypothetical protein
MPALLWLGASAQVDAVPSAFVLEVLYVGVRAGEELADVTVVLPANQEGRCSVLAEDLEDLAIAFVFADVMALDRDPVSRSGSNL